MANQPRVLAWQRGKEQPVMRSVAPERLESLRCTGDGSFILGGGQSGRLHAWEAGTGLLLAAFEAHYNAISCIATTDDDSYVITAGGDAIIHVWLLADILRSGTIAPKPRQTWCDHATAATRGPPHCCAPCRSDHTLPVTALLCGAGGVNGRVFSASRDNSCKVVAAPRFPTLRHTLLDGCLCENILPRYA